MSGDEITALWMFGGMLLGSGLASVIIVWRSR